MLDLSVIEAGIRLAIQEHDPLKDLSVKVIVTRGAEGTGKPTAWARLSRAGLLRATIQGAKVITLDRGYRNDVAKTSPWLLQGATTHSYAVNQAALREAGRRGIDDAVFVSSNGYVLEGPNSTFLCSLDATITTPSTDQGVLVGTTQTTAFKILESRGCRVESRPIATAELAQADAMWLASSGRAVAPISQIDDRKVPVDRELTTMLLRELRSRET